jgi:transposase-like protein
MVKPEPNLERRIRRVFTPDYKVSILQRADACKHGELGQLLRHEKLYSGQLLQWRREMAEHGLEGLSKSTPGPAPRRSANDKRIEQLERENARLRRQLEVKEGCLRLQKKPWICWKPSKGAAHEPVAEHGVAPRGVGATGL